MKKHIALLLSLCLLALCGCSAEAPSTPPVSTTSSTTEAAVQTLPPVVTTAPPVEVLMPVIQPDTVGLYIPAGDGTSARIRVTEFSAPWNAKADIDCFEVIASHAERLDGSGFVSIWKDTWNSFQGSEAAKIGFHIDFQLATGETVSKLLLKPGDCQSFFEYLEIYLYDDINNAGGWYSHIEDNAMNSSTIISSIKLHCGSRIDEITSDIRLTAFIYTGDNCFDADGDYIGYVFDSITITR